MSFLRKLARSLTSAASDELFLQMIKKVETVVSKLLSIVMIGVLLVSVLELCFYLVREIMFNNRFVNPEQFFTVSLIQVFGLFLNILVALEILENITAYLRKHVVQVELVIVTSLTAVARKIIIFDFTKSTGLDLVGLGTAVVALAASYWIIRRSNATHGKRPEE